MGAIRKSELHVHLGEVKYRSKATHLTTNNIFFKNKELKYDVFYNKITFKVPSMEDKRRVIKPLESKITKNAFSLTIYSDQIIEHGDYLIDEDSMNEDEITIYLTD